MYVRSRAPRPLERVGVLEIRARQLPPDKHHVTGFRRRWQHGASTPWRIIARSTCADLSALVLDAASAWTRPSEKLISWEKSFLTKVSWPGGYEQRSSEGHVYIEAFLSIDIHILENNESSVFSLNIIPFQHVKAITSPKKTLLLWLW